MAWCKKRMGHYCDRCDAEIWVNVRQDKYAAPTMRMKMAGDPYVGVSRYAFSEPEKSMSSNLMYCFDCEKELWKLLEAFNKEKSDGRAAQHP